MGHKRDVGITLTDLFCGAGGSSEGVAPACAAPYLALNHWARAIETHNTNFLDCHHYCTDVQTSDPRRYPSTNILIASPECTNHSLAKGVNRQPYKKDLFGNALIERCIVRASNPGDVVPDYFMGIGSVGVVALEQGRRTIGAELKESYYDTAVRYLQETEFQQRQPTLFDLRTLEAQIA